jgi:ABC-2 type transport system permease protein
VLWRRFLIAAIARESEYRVSFLLAVVEGLVQVALVALTFGLLYRYTADLAGWSRDQVLVLVGVYRVVDGLIAFQVAPNLRAIPGYVRGGELDVHLMRPASSQFVVSTRRFALPEAVNVAIGLGVVLVAGPRAGVEWNPLDVGAALLFVVCGVVLLYALWFAIMCASFWLVTIDTFDRIFYALFDAAPFPVSFFPGAARLFFTFAFPIAFATTFPTEALLGRRSGVMLLVAIAMSALAVVATNVLWRRALRHYESASS